MRLTSVCFFITLLTFSIYAQKTSPPPPPAPVVVSETNSNFTLKEDGFNINFPAKPIRNIKVVDTAFGKTNMVSYQVAGTLAFYGVTFLDFPSIIDDKAEINLRFDAVKAGLLKDPQSRLVSETGISFGGNPGIEYVIENKDNTLTIRCLVIKQRFFQLTAVTKGSIKSTERVQNFNRKTTEKFINSFFVTQLPPPVLSAVELPKDFGIEIKNKTFSSQFLGFSVQLPQDWVIIEKEQAEILKDLGKQRNEESTSKSKDDFAFSINNTEILLIMTKAKLETATNHSVITFAAEKISFPNFLPEKVAEKFLTTYIEKGQKILKKPSSIKLDGVDFVWAEIENPELNAKERFYVANRKGMALEILFIYRNEEELKAMIDSLQTIKFQ